MRLRYFRSRSVILLYHRVAEVNPDPWSLCVSPEHFAEHLEVLRRFRPVRLDWLGTARAGARLNVAITFDDGYADNLYAAASLLERYDTPATFFIATGSIGAVREFWWDELERIVFQSADPWGLVNHVSIGDPIPDNRGSESAFNDSREDIHLALYQQLQPLAHGTRRLILDRMLAACGQQRAGRPSHRPLTSEELWRLASHELFEIGAHTVTHPLLAAQAPSVQQAELDNSRMWLETFLERPISSFSYPYGGRQHYSDATVEAVRRAGFQRACTTEARPMPGADDPWQWGRFHVPDMDGDEFEKFLLAA